jgi:hypothetical protein
LRRGVTRARRVREEGEGADRWARLVSGRSKCAANGRAGAWALAVRAGDALAGERELGHNAGEAGCGILLGWPKGNEERALRVWEKG